MTRKALLALPVILAAFVALVPASDAQSPIEDFTVETSESRVDVPAGGSATAILVFRDTSRDAPGGIVPGTSGSVLFHSVEIKLIPKEEKTGWQVLLNPAFMVTSAGSVHDVEILFQAEPNANDAFYEIDVEFTFRGNTITKNSTVHLLGYSLGLSSFTAQVSDVYQLKPRQIVDVPVTIRNTALSPRSFDMEVIDNPCGMTVATTNGNVVDERSVDRYTVSLQAPARKFWYAYDSCSVAIEVRPQDNPSQVRTAIINVQVAGFYVDPQWMIWISEAAIAITALLWFIARRKARVEEEILGKPQKPWTIPVEAVYLSALKEKDPRAWYLVRHHLMEEEYRSSLQWYASYKKATRGSRKKETLVLRQEKAYAGWQRKWAKQIAAPLKEADRFEAKLQRKLDRRGRKESRKQEANVRSITRKMQAAHAKQVERALEKWQKQAKKAAKKGEAAPARPVLPEPDYPQVPEAQRVLLADHKWAKKAAKFRAKAVRKQGDLEVKFEKADARMLARLRWKVQRIARRLDDPAFVEEHPLLRSGA